MRSNKVEAARSRLILMACFCVPVLVRVRSVCVCAYVGRIASVATARCAIAPSSGPRGPCSSSFVSSAIGNCIKVRHGSAALTPTTRPPHALGTIEYL